VVVDAASGTMAAATEAGVWLRRVERHGDVGAMLEPGEPAWDVAIAGKRVAGAFAGGVVRIWDLESGAERYQLAVEAEGCALRFSADGERLFIGLSNGDVWEWSGSRLMRVAALGIGPIMRLRISGDGRVAIAAGQSPDGIDNDAEMQAGIAVWSP